MPAPVTPPTRPPAGRPSGPFVLDARSLAVGRMLLGTILLVDAIVRSAHASATLAPDGFLPPDLVRNFIGHPWAWSMALVSDGEPWGRLVLVVEGFAGALLAVGLLTRVATPMAWVALVSVVRRTAPMTNAGDVFLACLLFWGCFLPLGSAWSIDAARHRDARPPTKVRGSAAWALVLQVFAVYFSAGLGKCNETWWSGDAIAFALSVHDHGTPLGDAVAASGFPARLLTWATLLLELAGPPLLLVTAVRTPLVLLFVAFHAAIAVTMDVCLFPWVGIAAWTMLLPERVWSRAGGGTAPGGAVRAPRSPAGRVACLAGLAIAATALVHANGPWSASPAPAVVRHSVALTMLEQDWRVFGELRRQRQWAYAEATLADGSVVDLLRGGRPVERVLPEGGFHSIGDQRLQKLLWEIPKSDRRVFAAAVASRLARDWNAAHPAGSRVETLELRGGRRIGATDSGSVQDVLLAAWPERSRSGGGNLDRFLRDRPDAPPAGH